MNIEVMKSKIHNVKVTDARLDYVGSITIDNDWIEASGMVPGEKVLIVNNNNGERIETYVIKGKAGSKVICLNGAAAHKFNIGDEVIIIAFGLMPKNLYDFETYKPSVIFPQPNGAILTTKDMVWRFLMEGNSIEDTVNKYGVSENYVTEIKNSL